MDPNHNYLFVSIILVCLRPRHSQTANQSLVGAFVRSYHTYVPQPTHDQPTGGGGGSASGRSMLGEAGVGEMDVAKSAGREHAMPTVGGGRAPNPKAIPSARSEKIKHPTALPPGTSGKARPGAASAGEIKVSKGAGTGRQTHAASMTE